MVPQKGYKRAFSKLSLVSYKGLNQIF